jgi:hypothetical protein
MKGDFELIRNLLNQLEYLPACTSVSELNAEGFSSQEIMEHVELLLDADFLRGKIIPNTDGKPEKYLIHRITWAGHEFLALAKNDTVWKSALEQIKKAGSAVTIGILQTKLTTIINGLLVM